MTETERLILENQFAIMAMLAATFSGDRGDRATVHHLKHMMDTTNDALRADARLAAERADADKMG